MAAFRSDLPLGRDPSGRFLSWIVGLMVYLAALALAGAMAAERLMQRWHADLSGSFTVQLPPPEDAGERELAIDRALRVLTETPGVAGAEVLDEAEMRRLIEPWLGPAAIGPELPIPVLIAVVLRPEPPVAPEELGRRLAAAVPGALVDDHRAWLDGVGTLARSVQLVAAAVVALVALAAIATVVFATRTGLAIHRRVVDLLHLVGAQDAYIARQFQTQALRLGLVGGVLGLALAAITLGAVEVVIGRLDRLLLAPLSLDPAEWLALGLLPPAAGAIAMLTARITVLRALGKVL